MRVKVKEAILYAKSKGQEVNKAELARELWPDSSESTARVNFANLEAGKTKKVTIDHVTTICNKLGVTSDFLFGLSDVPEPKDAKFVAIPALVSSAKASLEQAMSLLQ